MISLLLSLFSLVAAQRAFSFPVSTDANDVKTKTLQVRRSTFFFFFFDKLL